MSASVSSQVHRTLPLLNSDLLMPMPMHGCSGYVIVYTLDLSSRQATETGAWMMVGGVGLETFAAISCRPCGLFFEHCLFRYEYRYP